MLPNDLVAVLALNRVTDFTADHERVVRFLQRYSARHEGFYLHFREFRRRQPLSDLPDQFYSAIDEVFQDVSSRAADELLLGMLAGRILNEPRWNRQPTSQDVLKAADRSRRRLADMLIDVPALKFYAGIEHLRFWEGQKHLVWIGGPLSGALQIRSVEDDKRLAARANDADVILNAIFTTGVNPGIRPDFVTGADVSTARILSESTGGYFTGLAYTNRALARIDERSRFSYLLGYEPTVKAFDGKYRQVRIQVKRRDVTAHYRQGYYAVEEISPVDIRELLSRARIAAAANARDLARDIKVTVAAGSLHESEGGRRLEVRVAIDPARLSLISGPDGRSGDLDVHVFCGDSRQRPVGDTRQRIRLRLDGPNYERMMRDGIVTIVQVPVIDRPRYVKVVVYDALGDMLGAASVTR